MARVLRYLVFLAITLFQSSATLAQIEITDSHGKYRFEKPPTRFVTLNWALAEQLLELGEMPAGIADLDRFMSLSTRYQVPESVVDVGPRLSPNLKTIRELKPDVIFIGYSQRSLIRPLSNIATVIYFKNFGRRYNNAEKSEERFLELAKLFQKSEQARRILRDRDQRLAGLNAKLQSNFSDGLPASLMLVAPTRRENDQQGVFGQNSLPFAAAQRVGLQVLTPNKTDAFGVAQLTYTELEELEKASVTPICVVVFDKYLQAAESSNINERIREKWPCVIALDYQQGFGGVLSLQWLAEEYVQQFIALLSSKS